MRWHSSNNSERVKLKIVFSGIDIDGMGLAFGGGLEHKEGMNETVFIFDTSYFVPGKYVMNFKLYDEDELGNVVYYDQCRGIRFNVIHNEDSLHLKHWFRDWGNAVLPCIEKL